MSKLKKCVAVFCLFCVLVYSMSAPARAIAGVDDLVVAGVTVMTMGLLGSFGIMALQASGAGDALLSAAESAGQTAKEYGQALFASYARSQNITAGQSVQLAAQGISYLEDGTIVFNKAVSNMMDGFVNWAWDAEGGELVDSATPISNNGLWVSVDGVWKMDVVTLDKSCVYGGYTWYYSSAIHSFYANASEFTRVIIRSQSGVNLLGEKIGITYTKNGTTNGLNNITICVAVPFSNSGYGFATALVRDTGVSMYGNTSLSRSSYGEDYLYNSTFSRWSDSEIAQSNITMSSYTNSSNPAGSVIELSQYSYADIIGGYSSDPVYDTNLGVFEGVNSDPDTNVGAYLDTGALLQDLDAGTAAELANGGTIDIQDWIDCIIDLISEGEATIPVEIAGENVVDVPLEHVGEMDIPVEIDTPTEGVIEQEVANSTSVDGLDEYTLDLLDFFPFCIPFDIYDMLSMFSAQRQAPVVNWRFYVPGICDETIELDFSIFDSAAQVLRSVELVAAAIGLAFVTKKLIQGGD